MSAHSKDPLLSYLAVFVTLMALLGLTLGAYCIDFSSRTVFGINLSFMNTVIALTIASIKALLVMLVFMHLRHSTKLTWIVASAGFIWLTIMMSFTFADYLSRNAIPEEMKPALTSANTPQIPQQVP
jgi:cytochrome c oxidase subunit 4